MIRVIFLIKNSFFKIQKFIYCVNLFFTFKQLQTIIAVIKNYEANAHFLSKYKKGKQKIVIFVSFFLTIGFLLELIQLHQYYTPFKFYFQLTIISVSCLSLLFLISKDEAHYRRVFRIVSYFAIGNIVFSALFFSKLYTGTVFDLDDSFRRNIFILISLMAISGFVVHRNHIIIQGLILIGYVVFEIFVTKDKFIQKSAITYIIVIIGTCSVLHYIVKNLDIFLGQLKINMIEIQNKNNEIIDSINYAKRLQTAILPPNRLVEKYFVDSFIFYKPKDIVAGDFYWMEVTNDHVFFALGDCTGHGVPGALLSVVCHNALNRSVRDFNLVEPGKILDKTKELVVAQLQAEDQTVYDGMDISLCVLDQTKKTLFWAGANSPLLMLRDGEVIKFKPNKQPVGLSIENAPFVTNRIQYTDKDVFYMYSDGYVDQFGGPNEKKMKYKKLVELILDFQSIPITSQKKAFEEAFEKWKGRIEQVDDVCLIGVQFSK